MATRSMVGSAAVAEAPKQYLMFRVARLSSAPTVPGRDVVGKFWKEPETAVVPVPREV